MDDWPQWISAEERLPEDDGSYLAYVLWPGDEYPIISIINYDSTAGAFGYFDKDTLGWAGSDFCEVKNVYAWMTLPEPPKEVYDG